MRMIATSDWHITGTTPRIRKDDYQQAGLNKTQYILAEALERDCDIAVAGDIFDGPRCPWWLYNMYVKMFRNFPKTIHVIPGQHDMHFHNPNIDNTPLGGFISSNVVSWGKGERGFGKHSTERIYGVEFEGDMPDTYMDIILAHMPITPGDPPFFMEDAISAADALKKYHDKCELLITGDYHVGFYEQYKDCTLINPGPIMRSSKDKMDYVPKIYYYEDGKVEEIPLPIEEDVFDVEVLERDSRRENSEELKELAGAIGIDTDGRNDFKTIVDVVMTELKTEKDVKEVVHGIVRKCIELNKKGK